MRNETHIFGCGSFLHGKESILIRKYYRKDGYVMEKIAVPTGDVVKDMDVDREEYLFFLLKNETSEFRIGLGDILECL